MPKLVPLRPFEVVRKLRAAGFEGPFPGGRHLYMRHPVSRVKVSVPTHGQREIPAGTLRAILREAGISREDWSRL